MKEIFVRNSEGKLVRDKSRNTPEFNKKAKKRREKSKQAAKSRKINRRK